MAEEKKGNPTTFLDWGKTTGNHRVTYAYHEGQEAYDLYMGARYVCDMIAYRNGEIDKVFHPEDLRDNTRKYSGLVACDNGSDELTFYEVGSSVMGVIDALEYLNIEYNQLDIKDTKFLGVDNSKWMNAVAEYTHEQYNLKLWEDVKDAEGVECDLFFAKGVSLMYAFQDEDAMCDVLKNSKLAIFDYTFSLDGKIQDHTGTGLGVTYLNLDKCKGILEREKGKILVMKPYQIKTYHQGDPTKASFDCIYGEREIIDKYLADLEDKTGENLYNYGNPKFIKGGRVYNIE